MKKKLLSTLLAMTLAATTLVACGGNSASTDAAAPAATEDAKEEVADEASSEAPASTDGETVSIYVYGNDQEQAMYQELFDKFAAENNCKVDAQFSIKDDYGTTITGMMTAKNLPDVFYMGPENVSQYVENGYVMDLKPAFERNNLDTSDVLQDILGMYEYNGGLYGVPHDSSVFAYAYNKDLFDEAGLPYPDSDNPYTYDEFVEVCKALTKDKDGDGEVDQWGCAFANAFMFYQFVWGNDASFCSDDYKTVTVTDPKFEEALQKYVDLTLVEKVTPTVEQDVANGPYQRWLDGQVAFYACGTWDIAAFMDKEVFKYDWDLCGYPILGSGVSQTWCGTVGYCVSSNTQNPDLAAKLAYYMSASKEAMKLLSGIDGGASIQIPNLVSMVDTDFAGAVNSGTLAYPEHYEVLFNYLNGEGKFSVKFMETTFTPNAEWMDLFFEGLDSVKSGSISVTDYCEKVQPDMQELLDEAWELVE